MNVRCKRMHLLAMDCYPDNDPRCDLVSNPVNFAPC